MKLYYYDHCPYCVRARMVFGLRGVAVEERILANDDEAAPIAMIGAKQLPILQKPDGGFMGESLDIVRYIDELAGGSRLDETVRPELQQWMDKLSAYYNRLAMPRDVRIGLPEFATQSAVDYFTQKKEQFIGSFADNLAKTGEYLAELAGDLAALDALLLSERFANGQAPSMEDILLFPMLRNLSMVRGAPFTARQRAYLDNMSQQSKVPLYFDRAV